jgi:hypothetical protein
MEKTLDIFGKDARYIWKRRSIYGKIARYMETPVNPRQSMQPNIMLEQVFII